VIVTGSSRWKTVATGLGVVLALALVGALYLGFRISAAVDPSPFGEANMLDAKEASRKLKLLETALASGQSGFIRLSKVEINSLIDEKLRGPSTNTPSQVPSLLRCRVDFNPASVRVLCWTRTKFLGRGMTVVWERSGNVVRDGDRWVFNPTSMKLGDQPVAQRYWPWVVSRFGSIDEGLIDQCKWLGRVPAMQFTENERSQQAELRFFTYADTNLLTQVKP
jgi:hypothetical protein